jgi:hypothetical protein
MNLFKEEKTGSTYHYGIVSKWIKCMRQIIFLRDNELKLFVV